MSKPVIRANVLPTPPLSIRLELRDTKGAERVIDLDAELLSFKHIWDPEREADPEIPEGDRAAMSRATALLFFRQLTPRSWAEFSEATECETPEEAVNWIVGNPVGTGAFQAAVELGDRLATLSYPDNDGVEKKKRIGNRAGIMFLLSLVSASGWIFAAWQSGLPGKLGRFIANFG